MHYLVNSKFGTGASHPCARFKELPDARLFIDHKLNEDNRMGVSATYTITEFDEIVATYPPRATATTAASVGLATGTQGQASGGQGVGGARFSPTPFNTTPKPAGASRNWVVDPQEKDQDK